MTKSSCFKSAFSFQKAKKQIKLVIFLYFGNILCQVLSQTTDTSGPKTKAYEIPSYYGSRDQDFLIKGFAVASNYSSFYWSHGVDVDYNDSSKEDDYTYYVIDANQKVIQKYEKNKATNLTSTSGGYRDGNINNSLFNGSTGLVFYHQKKYDAAAARYKKIIVVKDENCIKNNPPTCQEDTTLNDNSIIDPKKLMEDNSTLTDVKIKLPGQKEYSNKVLIVADTNNNCIRKIDLETMITTTVAGKCTTKGFRDGPFGTNLMDSPTSLGVDEQGMIYALNIFSIFLY